MRGQLLPPYDTRATLERLEAEVLAVEPSVLVFLGDSFHDARAEARLDLHDAARLAALAVGRTLLWVVGNHDADGPRRLPGEVGQDVVLAADAGPRPQGPRGSGSAATAPLRPLRGRFSRGAPRCFSPTASG